MAIYSSEYSVSAVTNLSDDKKKRVLSEVLKTLGIGGDRRSDYLRNLHNQHVETVTSSQEEDDLDDLILAITTF